MEKVYLGNQILAEMLLDEKIDPESIDKDITYKIEKLSDDMTKLIFSGPDPMRCPCYCIFDGRYMLWYGDYGSFTFDCTWNTTIHNLPYGSPYYMWEKYDGPSKHKVKERDSALCKKELLDNLKSTYIYEEELTKKQRKDLIDYIDSEWYSLRNHKSLEKYEDYVQEVSEIFSAADEDQIEYINKVRNFNEDNPFLDNGDYELYSYGEKLPTRFLILFYKLSCISNMIEQTIFENNDEIINYVKNNYNLEVTEVTKIDRGSANIYSLNES